MGRAHLALKSRVDPMEEDHTHVPRYASLSRSMLLYHTNLPKRRFLSWLDNEPRSTATLYGNIGGSNYLHMNWWCYTLETTFACYSRRDMPLAWSHMPCWILHICRGWLHFGFWAWKLPCTPFTCYFREDVPLFCCWLSFLLEPWFTCGYHSRSVHTWRE